MQTTGKADCKYLSESVKAEILEKNNTFALKFLIAFVITFTTAAAQKNTNFIQRPKVANKLNVVGNFSGAKEIFWSLL